MIRRDSIQSLIGPILFRRLGQTPLRQRRTFSHDSRCARDGICQIEVLHSGHEGRFAKLARRDGRQSCCITRCNLIKLTKMGVSGHKRCAQSCQRVEGQTLAQHI
jgi:hypothetical protein